MPAFVGAVMKSGRITGVNVLRIGERNREQTGEHKNRDRRDLPIGVHEAPVQKIVGIDVVHANGTSNRGPMSGQSSRPQVSANQCTTPERKSAAMTPPPSANGTHQCARWPCVTTRSASQPSKANAVAMAEDENSTQRRVSS